MSKRTGAAIGMIATLCLTLSLSSPPSAYALPDELFTKPLTPTQEPLSVDSAPMPGDWSGTTNQDYPVNFTVAASRTSLSLFNIKYRLSCTYGWATKTITSTGTFNITGGSFTISTGGAVYAGTFVSATSANGTWSDSFYDPWIGYCSGSGTWTAAWQVAARIFLPSVCRNY